MINAERERRRETERDREEEAGKKDKLADRKSMKKNQQRHRYCTDEIKRYHRNKRANRRKRSFLAVEATATINCLLIMLASSCNSVNTYNVKWLKIREEETNEPIEISKLT